MIKIFLIICAISPLSLMGQKFMWQNGKAVPFEQTLSISEGDTFIHSPCNTFEIQDKDTINKINSNCRKTGLWIETNSDGSTSNGIFSESGHKNGKWLTYSKNGNLITEIEYVNVLDDIYILSHKKYVDGKVIVISEKSWFSKLYLSHTITISIIILFSFFVRIPINALIQSREFNIDQSPWIPFVNSFEKSIGNSLGNTYKFWWSNLSERNKGFGYLVNFLSIIALGGFFSIIIGLAISGDIK